MSRLLQVGFEQGSVGEGSTIQCPEGFSTPASVLIHGQYYGKFKVAPGQKYFSTSGERCEWVSPHGLFPVGSTRWVSWYTRFPSSFVPVDNTGWNIFAQLHGSPNVGTPNIDFHVQTSLGQPFYLESYIRGGGLARNMSPVAKDYIDALERSVNQRFVLCVKVDPVDGYAAIFHNDAPVAEHSGIGTCFQDDASGPYFKVGYYRPDQPPDGTTASVHHDEIIIGETYGDVC